MNKCFVVYCLFPNPKLFHVLSWPSSHSSSHGIRVNALWIESTMKWFALFVHIAVLWSISSMLYTRKLNQLINFSISILYLFFKFPSDYPTGFLPLFCCNNLLFVSFDLSDSLIAVLSLSLAQSSTKLFASLLISLLHGQDPGFQ